MTREYGHCSITDLSSSLIILLSLIFYKRNIFLLNKQDNIKYLFIFITYQ